MIPRWLSGHSQYTRLKTKKNEHEEAAWAWWGAKTTDERYAMADTRRDLGSNSSLAWAMYCKHVLAKGDA